MDKKTTPSISSSHTAYAAAEAGASRRPCVPSDKTLAFLRAFARNYRADLRLPDGLQGLLLG